MNIITLENDFLKISAAGKGGELQNIYSKKTGREYLWHGDPQFWGSRAPILFPIVGRLAGGKYRLDGTEYEMGIHGFARGLEFEPSVAEDGSSVTFTASADSETLKQYPFRFKLEVSHILKANTVTTQFAVTSLDDAVMYFSIGGHPGLACPFKDGESFEDYYLEFSEPETAGKLEIDGVFFTGRSLPFMNNETLIPLSYGLFVPDAVVLKDLRSEELRLKSRKNSDYISFGFKGFPLLAFWTKKDAPYVCFEPWFGHGDKVDFSGDFKDKDGVLALQPGGTFTCAYDISVVEH